MKNKYFVIFIIGVVLVIAGLWFSFAKKPLYEGLVDTSALVLVGISSSDTYYADKDLISSPNWKNVSGSFKQISASKGRLVGVTTSNTVKYGTQYSIPGSPFNWVDVPGTMKQVYFDFPFVVGLDMNGVVKYINDITSISSTSPSWITPRGTNSSRPFRYIATSLGRAYGVTDDSPLIWYTPDIRSGRDWIQVSNSLFSVLISGQIPITQITFDGDTVALVNSRQEIYYADTGTTDANPTPNWTLVPGSLKQIAVKNNMIIGINSQNTISFSPELKNPTWINVSTPSGIVLSWLDLMYPLGVNAVSERPGIATSTCTSGYTYTNGQCLEDCPKGFAPSGVVCTPSPIQRAVRPATKMPPLTYRCPAGTFLTSVPSNATCNANTDGALASVSPVAEVFAISGTNYTHSEAQTKCSSRRAVLATAEQLAAAKAAGASWSTPGWVSGNRTSVMYPDLLSVASVAPNSDGTSGANCFGIKPDKQLFEDILPFNTIRWNQRAQCPVGYHIRGTGLCGSTCPSGIREVGWSCISPIVPKTSMAAVSANYTCPSGFDRPAVVSCSGSTCGPAQTCYSTCPSGFSPSGSSCVGPITPKAQQLPTTGNTCPTGYTLSVSTCYQNCPSGSTDIGNNRCQVNSASRATASATYIPPCPANHTHTGSFCYKNCSSMTPSGMQDISGNNCQIPNTTRRLAIAEWILPAVVPCNSDEDNVIQRSASGVDENVCIKKCPTNQTSSSTSCTPASITRKVLTPEVKCNKNETVKNGMCVSKCPEGTYPNGEICTTSIKVVAAPPSIQCVSSAFGSKKKWVCDKSEDVANLLKDPSSITTYVDPGDQICVSDDADTGMFYCQSGEEAKANSGTINTIRTAHTKTCDNITKSYVDLSDNLTSLLLIQSGMTNGSTQLTSATTALDAIHTQLNCASPPNTQTTTLCNAIRSGSTQISSGSTNISSVLRNITPSIQAALNTHNSLFTSIQNFKCGSIT